MIRVQYTIDDGVLPITVELVGSGLTNIHGAYGTYSFENVPDGVYIIRFTDSEDCLYEADVAPCTDCYPGYTSVGDKCVLYEESEAIYTEPTFTVLAESPNTSYGNYGALLFDSWNYDGTGTYERFLTTYWKNNSTTIGPLNRTAIWASTHYFPQDIGFSFCINIAIEKTYYIGLGCDNWGKVKLNGEYIIEQDVTALTNMIIANGDDYDGYPDRIPFRYWYIYPLTLPVGQNVIEVFGHNETALAAAVGIQIYNATPDQLRSATSDVDLGDKILFDSIDLAGNQLQYEYSPSNGYHGYYCAGGFALNTCGEIVKCVRRDTIGCGESPTTTTTTTATGNIDLTTNLVSVWEFDETSGSTAYDAHGVNNGTINGPTVNQTSISNLGTCYLFTTSNNYVQVPDNSNLSFSNKQFTLNAWYKYETATGVLFYKSSASDDREYFLTSLSFRIFSNGSSSIYNTINCTTDTGDGNWHMITGVANGTIMKIYVDGVEENSTTLTGTLINGPSDLFIGKYGGNTTSIGGRVDQPAIWNRALNSDEIQALYNSGNGLAYASWEGTTTTTTTLP